MKRIQRKRTPGYRIPKKTKCVHRGTIWGNPFRVLKERGQWCVKNGEGKCLDGPFRSQEAAATKAVERYGKWVTTQIALGKLDLEELRDKNNLACFCALGMPCHADYLLELLK